MKTCSRKSDRARGRARDGLFEVINPDAAGIDVGATEMWVCVPEGRGESRVRAFGSDTVQLESIAAWLRQCGVKTVAMESTGVYWIALFQILENHGMEACLVNARHVKNVPGRRKTDRLDCQWLQKLHACGLLSASFRPTAPVCRLRAYLRHRANLVREQAKQILHMQKALREMNVLLDAAVSDMTGASGMRILQAIVAGQTDPRRLAELADVRVKKSRAQIAADLTGDYRPEHLFVLKQALELYQFVHAQIADCDREIEKYTGELERATGQADSPLPADLVAGRGERRQGNASQFDVRTHLYRLTGVDLIQIPGIGSSSALGLISETGLDMSRWPSDKHFASWLDLCPSPKVSGGRCIGNARRHAGNRASQIFRQAAVSLKQSSSWLGVYLRRMKARLGPNAAVKATAHKLALIYYRLLSTRTPYRELDAQDYQDRLRERMVHNLKRRARQLGMQLVPAVPAAATT